jgi:hypothetical protein
MVVKKKVYVLMISRVFPAYHPRAGEETYFKHKILLNQPENKYAVESVKEYYDWDKKLHTLRENYALWSRRAEKINRGEAILSLRQWTGSPYNYKRDGSKPVEFLQLEKIHVQKVKIIGIPAYRAIFIDDRAKNIHEVAKNDGLSVDDFCKWFKKDMEGCVIHFTDKIY